MAAAVVASGARSRAQSHALALFPRDLATFFKNYARRGGELRSGPMNFERDFNSVSNDTLITFRLPVVFRLHIFAEISDPCLWLDPFEARCWGGVFLFSQKTLRVSPAGTVMTP